ncbi:hypothetical protein [Actinokineospora sp. NBRC 105648]|uniref:hypothetical protein n=1 Tax=Actinokineospora sp. NBRC 105648 TaxID=3032206 RepID=UPI0024A39E3D|nr:hypothetical protein [Actinokineospora sp. NBRC 105648]GLZ36379.1 hypothetical protein Acsp05_00040 [Actinokineospora sp. NBRC 105648]
MDSENLAALLSPLSVAHVTEVLARWLRDAHAAALDLQEQRRLDERGGWDNAVSHGTDRYQFLVRTAASLSAEVDGLEPDRGFQSLLLKLPRVALYPFNVPDGPYGPVSTVSELRRELLTEARSTELALLTRRELWVEDRALVLLPWSGTEGAGLTGLWAGQGTLSGSTVDWEWVHGLSLDDAPGQTGLFDTGPVRPPAPEVRRRTRTRPQSS